jgi:hypothetical protein
MQGCYRKSGDFLRAKLEQEVFADLGFAGVSRHEKQAASKAGSQADEGLLPSLVRSRAPTLSLPLSRSERRPNRLAALVERHDSDRRLRVGVHLGRMAVD